MEILMTSLMWSDTSFFLYFCLQVSKYVQRPTRQSKVKEATLLLSNIYSCVDLLGSFSEVASIVIGFMGTSKKPPLRTFTNERNWISTFSMLVQRFHPRVRRLGWRSIVNNLSALCSGRASSEMFCGRLKIVCLNH